ncbi:MAG: hypothetical protein MI924_27130 [Chloroflexales bacterium]|nr:hypothetical protein [Chloroflexales bacterium]
MIAIWLTFPLPQGQFWGISLGLIVGVVLCFVVNRFAAPKHEQPSTLDEHASIAGRRAKFAVLGGSVGAFTVTNFLTPQQADMIVSAGLISAIVLFFGVIARLWS